MNKIIVYSLIYSMVFILALFTYLSFNQKSKIEIAQGTAIIHELDVTLKEDDEHTHSHKNDQNEAGYGYEESFVSKFQDIEETLNFFVAVLQEEEESYFTSMFEPSQFGNDLWTYSDEPHFNNAVYNMIREINRNGSLVSASYDTSIMDGYKTSREETEIELILIYEDEKKVTLLLDFVLIGTEHNYEDKIYFINNSVLEIIHKVKEQTK